MGRPQVSIDPDKIRILAMRDCNRKEMAATLGVGYATLRRRFDDHQRGQGAAECDADCSACIFEAAEADGRAQGDATLRTKLYDLAAKGNTAALIFLSKNRLGYTDRQEITDKRSENLVEVVAKLAALGVDEIRRRREAIMLGRPQQQIAAPVVIDAEVKHQPTKKKGKKA